MRDELLGRTYVPLPARRQEIPKDGGKVPVESGGAMDLLQLVQSLPALFQPQEGFVD